MVNYVKTLPEGYTECYQLDAKDKKVSLWLNLCAIPVVLGTAALLLLVLRPTITLEQLTDDSFFIWDMLFILSLAAYMILHELLHGLVYKLMTHQKLTFGLTLSVAFCGVPGIYVSRRTAMASLAAPLAVFVPVFGGLLALVPEGFPQLFAILLLALHLGGCVGDLYDLGLFLFRFRSPETLMRDTGPTQTFYLKK